MEATELTPDDEEHAKGLRGVLNLGQEIRCKPEGKRNFRGLVEVGLEDSLVEDEETLEDLELMLVGNGTADLVVQLRICKRLLNLQALI